MADEVIRLTPDDAERYAAIRSEMLADAPWAFGATPDDDTALDLAFLRSALEQEENAILAVEVPGRPALAAAAGIYRMQSAKFSHRAKLWGVFVDAQHRGKGLGRAVTAAAVALAASWHGVEYIDVAVSVNSPAAHGIYEGVGFVEWGREPEATQHEGRRYDEIHMSLRVNQHTGS